jgi:Lrp/AsnC family transcriptional regulator, leucine-responsive regulatory protein
LFENGRMTIRNLAAQIGLSSPSITERIYKLEDAGAIQGYTIAFDPTVIGLGIAAHVRIHAMPGEVKRLAQMLVDTPEVVEADRVTGEDCFLARVVVSDLHELESVIDRFLPFSSADIAIIQSTPVARRLPKF